MTQKTTSSHNNSFTVLLIIVAATLLNWLFTSCSTTKQAANTEFVHIRDSIVIVDTVYVPVHIIDKQVDTSAISVLQNSNDSLLNALQNANDKLAYQAKQLANGKLCIDTIRANTKYASAWACVTDNLLHIGLTQQPIDTLLALQQKTTKVTDVTSNTSQSETTIVKSKPFYDDMWFWIAVILALISIASTVYAECFAKRK